MKYRLKDRAMQAKLDAISNGDFSKMAEKFFDGRSFPITVYFHHVPEGKGGYFKFSATFQADEVEEVRKYDPMKWNEWPDVEPPRNKLLRTEILTERIDWYTPEPRGGQSRFKGSGIFDGKEWYFYDATTRKEGETVRFRPWVGPDEDDKK